MINAKNYYYPEAEKKLLNYVCITDLLRIQRNQKRISDSQIEDALGDLFDYLNCNDTITYSEIIKICKKNFN